MRLDESGSDVDEFDHDPEGDLNVTNTRANTESKEDKKEFKGNLMRKTWNKNYKGYEAGGKWKNAIPYWKYKWMKKRSQETG